MKKTLLASAAALAFSAVSTVGVFATGGYGSAVVDVFDHTATINEDIDETIYDVDIVWGDMTYGWKYNSVTGDYEIRSKVACSPIVDGVAAWSLLKERGNLYSDQDCTTLQTGEFASNGHYFFKTAGSGEITVVDNTVNGKVYAAASFTPTSDYDWVIGKFGQETKEQVSYNGSSFFVTTGYDAASGSFSFQDFGMGNLDGTFLQEMPNNRFNGYLYFEIDETADRSKPVESDDVIGTVTVTVSPR